MKNFLIFFSTIVLGCKSSIDYPTKGYDYPTNIKPADTINYIIQLTDSLNSKDSFEFSNNYRHSFTALGEPNLSIKPLAKPVYRLYYASVMDRPVAITLTENQIEIKEGIKGYGTPYYDTIKLTTTERFHYKLLQDYFPIQETRLKMYSGYFDSLLKIYPELLSSTYYQSLLDKSLSFGEDSFKYKIRVIPISKQIFAHLVNGINSSDYWDQPYQTQCPNPSTDGFGFSLEANTPQKYKIVEIGFCPGQMSMSFQKAWQELISYSGMNKRITLIWDEDKYATERIIK